MMMAAAAEAPESSGRRVLDVLIVEDSPVDRALVARLLHNQLPVAVRMAADGAEALDALRARQPDVVLTDLQMPVLDGLALVEAIRRDYPRVPTILMTAYGSEDIALAALQRGAASYVNKRQLAQRIGETVADVVAVSLRQREQRRLVECWNSTRMEFELTNDTTLIPVIVQHLQEYQGDLHGPDDNELLRTGVALHEALRNAIHHGNLELDSALRQHDPARYYRLAAERRRAEPYARRRVRLAAQESSAETRFVIRDEGAGFDARAYRHDPTDVKNLEQPSGRGLFLIRTFMDEVAFNDRGNEITMVRKRRPVLSQDAAAAPPPTAGA